MSTNRDLPTAVRAGEELPSDALAAYLAGVFNENSPLTIEQFRGGHSNLTYLLRYGERELVLRRPPRGSKVATAHDMGREFRVLSALSKHYDKAPRPINHCENADIIGAPFYLMERVDGIVLRRKAPAELNLDAQRCKRLCQNLVDTLAELHTIDFKDIGLGELGRPAGYIERQVTGWTKRYENSKTDEYPEAQEVAEWLAANQPESDRAALIHNDFKFDNLVLDRETLEVVGILDWEMSTVGDPWMDLGTTLCYWVEAGDPPPMQQLAFAPTSLPGMWTRAEIIERYQERTNARIESPLFFYVFGLYKLAGVVQQIYYRYAQGLTKDERFATLGQAAHMLLLHAAASVKRGRL